MKINFEKVRRRLNDRGMINFIVGRSYYHLQGDSNYAGYLTDPRKFKFIEGEGQMFIAKYEDEENMRVVNRWDRVSRFVTEHEYEWMSKEENLIK